MDNIVLADTPVHWPCMCVTCGSQKGPIADTGNERNGERIYLCKRCVMTLARVFGFAKGEKMDELSRAVDVLAEKDRQLETQAADNEALRAQLSDARRRGEALNTLLEQARAKELTQANLIQQMNEPLRQLAGTVSG